MSGLVNAYDLPHVAPQRMLTSTALAVVEVYPYVPYVPYVPYIQYLLPGSIVTSIFMMVMIGRGIIFIDDKAHGLHEGYLVTPITRLELILGFTLSGAIKAVLAGLVLMTLGTLIAGVPNPFDPMRLLRLFVVIVVTSTALVSMMFLLRVHMTDPLLPRAIFRRAQHAAVFPERRGQSATGLSRMDARDCGADPFTYGVHALKNLVLKNTRFGAIGYDLLFLFVFTRDDDACHIIVPTNSMRSARPRRSTRTAKRATRAPRDSAETRTRLLAAARSLFAERGFEQVAARHLSRNGREHCRRQLPFRRPARPLS